MKAHLVAFLSLAILFLCVHYGFGIKCYICNSFNDPGCADFFNNATYVLHPCPPEAKYCRKIVQQTYYEGQWQMRFIRQCATHGELDADRPHQDWNCFDKIGTYRVKVKYCHCRVDGCNSAARTSTSYLLLIIPVLLWTTTRYDIINILSW